MNALSLAFDWLTEPANWSGPTGILIRLWEHTYMSVIAIVIAAAIALPVGMYIGHRRRFEIAAVQIANIGRALPSFGVLAIVFPLTLRYLPGIGFYATLITLVLLAIPPVLTNAYVGIKNVDADTIESARGMGMSEREVLFDLEVPLAMPLIIAGLRTASVAVVATATLGALVGWGGLGRFIIDGLAIRSLEVGEAMLVGGAILVALMAVITDLSFGLLERLSTPKGLRPPRTTSSARDPTTCRPISRRVQSEP